MEAKILREALRNMYSNLNYFEFCEYMGINPDHGMEYWKRFQALSSAVAKFDDNNLQKIIDYKGA